jgi:ubiquinone/menaquinone biosynthesis C-methylase UbiE
LNNSTQKESDNELLKNDSKKWWSDFSQDYVSPGETDHLGVPEELDDESFLKYLEYIDGNFMQDGFFAQNRDKTLFSNLIPRNLSGLKVLEIGCGLGAHTEQLCLSGAEVTSIDLAPQSINITKRRLKLKKLSANVFEADAEKLPFEDSEFDFIWSWGVIHHSPNTLKCAQEIERILKKNGELRIMLYHSNSFYNWINVIFRYGILQGKLLKMSIQDLHNRYTDGKKKDGAPLAKYYSRKEIKNTLFPNLDISSQTTFEQKNVISSFFPKKYRRKIESYIPDRAYKFIWSYFGFLIFTIAKKSK